MLIIELDFIFSILRSTLGLYSLFHLISEHMNDFVSSLKYDIILC